MRAGADEDHPIMGGQSRKGTGVHWSAVGQKRKWPCLNGMSVLPPRADLVSPARHVRFVPDSDMSRRREVAHKDKWLFRPTD